MLLRGKRSRYRTQPQIEAFQGNREPRFFFLCQRLRHSKEIESRGFFLMQAFERNKEPKVFFLCQTEAFEGYREPAIRDAVGLKEST